MARPPTKASDWVTVDEHRRVTNRTSHYWRYYCEHQMADSRKCQANAKWTLSQQYRTTDNLMNVAFPTVYWLCNQHFMELDLEQPEPEQRVPTTAAVDAMRELLAAVEV